MIAAGAGENAPAGVCFMSATGPKTVKSRVHLDLTRSAADRDQEIDRLLALGARRADIGQTGTESWIVLPTPKETSSASCARRKRSSVKAQYREPQTGPVRPALADVPAGPMMDGWDDGVVKFLRIAHVELS
jgi:hypothetical protein